MDSPLRTRELLHEAHDLLAQQQEEQYVGHGHQVQDAVVQAPADGLLTTELPAIAALCHRLAHGTALRPHISGKQR